MSDIWNLYIFGEFRYSENKCLHLPINYIRIWKFLAHLILDTKITILKYPDVSEYLSRFKF